MPNEWETIVAWIKEQKGIPKDSEVLLTKPHQLGSVTDDRMWIDVLSEEWGLEHGDGSHPGDPEGYYDPTVRQYHLIETDLFYKNKLVLEELLELYEHEERGNPDYLPSDEWRSAVWNRAKAIRERLRGVS